MLMIIAIVFALVVFAILIYAAMQPGSFRVQRSIDIRASTEKIFPHVNDFHLWDAWSPWEKVDPAVKRTYGGAEQGVGATYGWEGNKDIGEGRMTIVESIPSSKVLLDIEFIKPFAGKNKIEFTLANHGDTTTLTQAMFGPTPYIAKLMCLFFNRDKMIGDKYEEGLASLKTIAES
ncbi:MAG: SRPBCC family protein [Arenimonas sp.]